MATVLLVGCGRISKKHISVLQTLQDDGSNISITAVLDLDPAKAQEATIKTNAKAFTSYEELLDSGMSFTYGVILTPSGLHVENAVKIIDLVQNLVIEKPLALTLEDADHIIQLCAEKDKGLFVVKQNRLNPAIEYLKQRFERGDFGKIALATIRVRWCRRQSYYDQDEWRGTWLLDGGVLANQASHHLDLLQWIVGDVEFVFGIAGCQLVDIEAEDTAVVSLRFSSGALGIIEATTAARPSDIEGSISILGENGMIEIGGKAVNSVLLDTLPPSELTYINEDPQDVYGFGHYKFYQLLLSPDQPLGKLVDGFQARKSLELISAIYESISTCSPVNINFKSRFSSLGRRK